ncbi:hypothetical protein I302_101563 [Kwoniella bestiolae CBS 10118]|uniref:cAMP-independent regulatory protein pac2 n=1 Tax=Kwoniella bestiolae CBS 10118 TaxID=1296100 RepID=A0A1B9GCM4_9TREE|nr:hypothetical protein I302_00246 [Kwoniella bestiolae CBS 10118]OCF28757.1 hypothetical protein I302_00246 [Kwoniella bestiolae CBS 10118]
MEMYQGSSTQQPAAICALKSPVDAIHILEAVRLGIVPRVTRRLTGHERAMIRPGTVWVWEEEETNMRRWTDGRRWGASRVGGGGFLVYTESSESHSPPPARSDSPYGQHNGYYPGPSSSRRQESLIKQTYSTSMTHPVTGKLKKFHVVAYSSKHNPQGDAHNPLPLPHQLPALASLRVTPGIWPEWEHRREQEFGATGRRPPSASSSSSNFMPPSQSAPVTAVSSPNGPPYSVVVPPTAFPASGHPPSPRNDGGNGNGMYGRPFPPPPPIYPRNGYDDRNSPALPPLPPQGNLRGPSAPYPQPPPRRDQYDTSAGYPGRHMSVPPMYPNQPPPGSERFHPYGMQSRNTNRVTSYPPPSASIPSTPTDREMGSPSQQYPFAYSRPDSRGYETKPNPERLSPETTFRADGNTDPRRYPSNNENGTGTGHSRQVSNASASASRAEGSPTQNSPNTSSRLQPPSNSTNDLGLAAASGRSPKMSISSTLLNTPGTGTAGQGVTLPPLRTTLDKPNGSVLPSPGGGVSPGARSGSVSDSPNNELKKDWQGKGANEDARQLGELGRRVVL